MDNKNIYFDHHNFANFGCSLHLGFYSFQTEFCFHFLEVVGKRTHELTEELIKDRAYSILYARKFEEELENTLRTMRAEAFVEFKNLD